MLVMIDQTKLGLQKLTNEYNICRPSFQPMQNPVELERAWSVTLLSVLTGVIQKMEVAVPAADPSCDLPFCAKPTWACHLCGVWCTNGKSCLDVF